MQFKDDINEARSMEKLFSITKLERKIIVIMLENFKVMFISKTSLLDTGQNLKRDMREDYKDLG